MGKVAKFFFTFPKYVKSNPCLGNHPPPKHCSNGPSSYVADFYENKHLNSDLLCVNYTELSDDEFYSCLADANKQLLENYYKNARKYALDQVDNLYVTRDANFRGFRHSSGGTSNVNMMA